MTTCQEFPKDWHEFVKNASFKDSQEVYTNGSELIPVFRVEQLIEHLLKEQDELLKHEYWRGYNNGRADERGLQEGTIMQTFSPD